MRENYVGALLTAKVFKTIVTVMMSLFSQLHYLTSHTPYNMSDHLPLKKVLDELMVFVILACLPSLQLRGFVLLASKATQYLQFDLTSDQRPPSIKVQLPAMK